MSSFERISKEEAAGFAKVIGFCHLDEAKRRQARKDLEYMIEIYESGNPDRKMNCEDNGDK